MTRFLAAGIIVIGLLVGSYFVLAKHGSIQSTTANNPTNSTPDKNTTAALLANSTLRFQANQGQVDKKVDFVVRNGSTTIFFTPNTVVYSFPLDDKTSSNKAAPPTANDNSSPPTKYLAVIQSFVGAGINTSVTGLDPLDTKINYMIGNSDQWQENIPTYSAIKYNQLYKGIDFVCGGTGKDGLKFTYVVAAQADYKQIKVLVQGIKKLSISDSGELVIETVAGNFNLRKPSVSQIIDGTKKELPAGYVIDKNTFGFVISGINLNQPVVIET